MIKVATILAPHGVKGLVKIKTNLESFDTFLDLETHFNETGAPLKITPKFFVKESLVAHIQGVNDRTAAERLKRQGIYTSDTFTSDPDEERYLYSDLIGLNVLVDNKIVGQVKSLQNYGASDILEIQTPEGSIDIPFLEVHVPDIDLESNSLSLTSASYQAFKSLNASSSSESSEE